MPIYLLYIHDGRYSVPHLESLDAPSDDRALAHARVRLAGSSHYLAIEVWEDDRLVGRTES